MSEEKRNTNEISTEEREKRFREYVRLSKEMAKVKNQPVCEYDKEKKQAYILFPDGRKVYYSGYDIEVEADILRSNLNVVVMNYRNYIDSNKIDDSDSENPVVNKYDEAVSLFNRAYSFRTYEEIDNAEQKMNELKNYFNEL